MRLLLSNYRTECEPRELTVEGNPLLTFNTLYAGDGVPGSSEHGSTCAVLHYEQHGRVWILDADGSEWTDVEVVGMDTGDGR